MDYLLKLMRFGSDTPAGPSHKVLTIETPSFLSIFVTLSKCQKMLSRLTNHLSQNGLATPSSVIRRYRRCVLTTIT